METGERLIHDLYADPLRFNDEGRAYQLLQEYFNGFQLDTLRSLLSDEDPLIRRAGVWITSELGADASCLLPEAISLVNDGDRYIEYHALEIIMACSELDNHREFVHVVRSLDSSDDVLRQLAMRLVANANEAQLDAAITFFEEQGTAGILYARGLLALRELQQTTYDQVLAMIQDEDDPLSRKFGAIAAKMMFSHLPELIGCASKSVDPDVARFAQSVLHDQVDQESAAPEPND